MAAEDRVRELLTQAADPPGPPLVAPAGDLLTRARRRRRRRMVVQVTVSACAVLAAVLVPLGLLSAGPGHHRPAPPADGYPTSGPATAQALGHDRWTVIAPSPIEARSQPAAVWTGSQMLVWGGVSGQQQDLHGDGAAYDAVHDFWQRLPDSPLSPRSGMAAVWTGTRMFVWGGYDRLGGGQSHVAGDGAMYDPATGRWTRIASSPLSPRAGATAVWAAGRVVVLGGRPAVLTDTDRAFLDAAAYDPVTDRWTALPALPLPAGQTPANPTAVAAGDAVYAWLPWSRVEHHGNTVTGRTGMHMYRLDPGATHWTEITQPEDHAADVVNDPQWTGRELLLPAAGTYRGPFSGPPPSGLRGRRYDPATGQWTLLPHGPVDDLNASSVWTGAALLSYASSTYAGGPDGVHRPGEAAAWDPTTDRWVDVPNAPYAADSGQASVWTGDALLTWGSMYPASEVDGHSPVHPRTIGLRLGPTTARTSGAPTNRESATRRADQLLALARVPDGARHLDSAPPALPGPVTGTPAVDSLVDQERSWKVPMPFDETLSWLHAHPPHGLTQWATAGPGSNPPRGGYSYGESGIGGSGTLSFSVAPDGNAASYLRVDAQVIWLDPTPVRDTASGRRLRVTVDGGCPPSDQGVVSVSNPGQRDLDTALVPDATPTAALVCTYLGLNGQRFALQRSQTLDTDTASLLAATVANVPLSHPTGGVSSCPSDDGSAAVVAFRYPGRPDVDLWFPLGGCGATANGHIVASRSISSLMRRLTG